MRAWATARRGDIEGMKREGSTIENYLLHPYLEYNELLATRRTVDPERMSAQNEALGDDAVRIHRQQRTRRHQLVPTCTST